MMNPKNSNNTTCRFIAVPCSRFRTSAPLVVWHDNQVQEQVRVAQESETQASAEMLEVLCVWLLDVKEYFYNDVIHIFALFNFFFACIFIHILCIHVGVLKAQELMREAKMLKAQVDKENSKAEKTLTSAKKERKRLKRELVALNKLRKKAHSYRAQTRAMTNYNFSPASAIPMSMGASSLYSTRYTTPAGKLP